MTATVEEVNDLRADLGDTTSAFTQEELERLLERSQDSAGNNRHFVALAYGILQLLNQANRFATYTVNEAQERRGEIAQNLRATYKLLLDRPDVAEELGAAAGGGMVTRSWTFKRTLGASTEYSVPD